MYFPCISHAGCTRILQQVHTTYIGSGARLVCPGRSNVRGGHCYYSCSFRVTFGCRRGTHQPSLNERMRRRHLCWTASVIRVLRTVTMQPYGCHDPLYAEVSI
ncbi:hypothetical protein PISMIDRAFT_238888 [Pisolithus microcarpus 441]|uniref:Uncharacterized protein n=1 Tax=Pisolithus microcarpus 441 TaxID=765257 RepID=A0A0C9XX42_9AGAM|nr:hypothetical protein PISMIDRAFT_238888 [Pisolithus microcarpus 441]